MKRYSTHAALVTVLLTMLALPLATPAAAEEHEEQAPEPILWVSFMKSTPGSSQPLIQDLIAYNTELYAPLMADGQLFEWGVAQPITHRGNDPYNVIEWATFPDWAAVDAFVARFMGMQAAMTEEERAARQEAYLSTVVAGSHADAVNQSIHSATNGQRPGYIVVGFQKAHAGQGGKLVEMWQAHARPIYEGLMSDGAIQGFGLFTQAVHGDSSWSHASWATVPGLASMTAIDKAFAALDDQEATMAEFMQLVDWDAHRDEIFVVVHYENPTTGQ